MIWKIASIILIIVLIAMVLTTVTPRYYKMGKTMVSETAINAFISIATDKPIQICSTKTGECIVFQKIK